MKFYITLLLFNFGLIFAQSETKETFPLTPINTEEKALLKNISKKKISNQMMQLLIEEDKYSFDFKYYHRYDLNFSKNFKTSVISAVSKQEIHSFLVNYNDKKIIDLLKISCSEIGKKTPNSSTKIENDKITISNYDFSSPQNKIYKEFYKILPTGEIKLLAK